MIEVDMGAGVQVQIDAARTDRSLVQAKAQKRIERNPVMGMWAKLIDQAVQDAKRTVQGLPTDGAILARWWIAEHQPAESAKEDWERSFACACVWLGWDAASKRKRLIERIDHSLHRQYEAHVQSVIYVRRAMVLSCAGFPTTIARQYMMPLVSEKDYEDVAGIDFGDEYVMYDQRDHLAPAA